MDGTGVSQRWREAREWWLGAPYLELEIRRAPSGARKEIASELPTLGQIGLSGQVPLSNDNREEWSIRDRKIRNESFSAAMGKLPPKVYERRMNERWETNVQSRTKSAFGQHAEEAKPSPKKKIGYVPLHLRSGYAFGESTILAEELSAFVALVESPAAALADPFSLVGAVEFARGCRRHGVKPLIGSAIQLQEGGEIVLIAKTSEGYQNLSQLISECHLLEPRGYPLANWERLERFRGGLLCLTGGGLGPIDRHLVQRNGSAAKEILQRLVGLYGSEDVFVEVERSYLPWQNVVESQLRELAADMKLLAVAGGVVTHARPDHYPAQDVLVCVETLCLVEDVIGRKPQRHELQPQVIQPPRRALNAERFLRTPVEMKQLFDDRPELLDATHLVAARCDEDVLPKRTSLPAMFADDAHALREIVYAESYSCYPRTARVRKRIDQEVDRIVRLGFATHFLVAWDMCRFAGEQGIQFSGRGSVVDSAVAFALGFSRIDAITHNLHFDRFLPADGSKRPDIDIDFEAHRRDDVRGYLVRRYGVDRVATVAAIGAYCTRGIVREVGKVLGIPNETIGYLAKKIHGGVPANQIVSALENRPELRDSNIPKEKFQWVFRLAERMVDIPRNIRCHSSGVVVSQRPISETVPVMGSATQNAEESGVQDELLRIIQWDKRSAKHYFDKFDILCLRGQDVLSGLERRVRTSSPDFSTLKIDATTDPEVYRAMRSGELIGIPQSASPAMRQAHIRLRTNDLHDASLVQAGIRPGVGGAVKINELIARRRGKPYSFEHPDLEKILGLTYGIIVFQEQVDQLLQTMCGYSSGEAEDIRDTIHKRRNEDFGSVIRETIIHRVLERGYGQTVAEQVFDYVSGFKGYGFAQGHALAFAEVSLRSVWCMQNHPASYFASLLSAQPAGYYGSATIANEARIRGAKILPLDINRSDLEFTVEEVADSITHIKVPQAGIRVGFMQLKGLSHITREKILSCRIALGAKVSVPKMLPLPSPQQWNGGVATAVDSGDRTEPVTLQTFGSFFDFVAKVDPPVDEMEALILSGAFDALHPNRRALLWAIPEAQAYVKGTSALLEKGVLPFDLAEPKLRTDIEDFSPAERMVYERVYLEMDVDTHLVSFERPRIASKNGISSDQAKRLKPGARAIVVGNPIRLRFPPTASGKRVVFFDLEDETGLLNVTCFDDVYRRDGRAIVCSQYVTILGEAQDRDGHIAFLAHRVFPYTPSITQHVSQALPLTTADFLVG